MEQHGMSTLSRNSQLAAYRTVKVHGGVADADPHGMVLMLMDAAVERMTTARGCIERGETVRKTKLLHSCVNIVAELRGSLNMEKGGEIARNLSDLYDYMMRRLLVANLKNDCSCLAEVTSLLSEIRAAWVAIGPSVKQHAPTAS
jgi:flagellar protein FliS